MVRKIITLISAAAVLTAAGGVVYADSCGVFLKDNESAKALVNKYMSSVMRSYSGEENVSFKGIVKEGCDFWYYNDYNNNVICETSQNAGTAETADYAITFDSVKYSGRKYTIEAEVIQQVKYKDMDETINSASTHTFIIEQTGRGMYITDDIRKGTDRLLLSAAETSDTPISE